MPIFATFIASLFGSLGAWIAKRAGERVAAHAIFMGLIVTSTLALYGAATLALSALNAVTPPFLTTVLSWSAPYNVAACIGARAGVEAACIAYHWGRLALVPLVRPGA